MRDDILTVDDVLKSKLFKNSLVIAGSKGLGKPVEWAHVMEVTNCQAYINGQEIVLTTGAGWTNVDDPYIFVNQLIRKKASALCIQLGNKFNLFDTIEDIPEKIIQKAEISDFPIIVFPKHAECRYVDLMRGLHSMIINKNYKTFQDQEAFLQQLHPIIIEPHSPEDILRLMHDHLKVNVAYIPNKGKALFIPPVNKSEQATIKRYIDSLCQEASVSMQEGSVSIAHKQVKAYGQTIANIAIYSDEYKLSNFDFMVLEKCSVVLGQDLLVDLLTREKERQSKEKWVLRWLEGRLKINEIEQMLQSAEPYSQATGIVACLVDYNDEANQPIQIDEVLLNVAAIARTVFCQQGFILMWQRSNQQLIYILIDTWINKPWKPRLDKALQEITALFLSNNHDGTERRISFSVGRIYNKLDQLHLSLSNAKEALHIRKKFKQTGPVYYDDLHVYRMIMLLENSSSTESFIKDYLGPILNDDKPGKGLLKTLIALRDCQYNKKDAAEKLLIARQSLYQRIKILEGLLGEDFMTSPEKRICTEMALYGLGYMNSSNTWDYLSEQTTT
jgi:PucR family transcriptional regulator, purine catabolism regulatory protein